MKKYCLLEVVTCVERTTSSRRAIFCVLRTYPRGRGPVRVMDRNVNENHLKEIFGCFGIVDNVSIDYREGTKIPTSTATVMMHSIEEGEAALKGMNNGQIDGSVTDFASL